MLIRIRRLAGSAVGAAFILLLSLSLLQTGQSFNFGSIFRPSPVVLEVGEEEQRWNSLNAMNRAANPIGISAESYANTDYGPLLTALALKDSWNGAAFSIPRSQAEDYESDLSQFSAVVSKALAPSVSLLTAQRFGVPDSATLLPTALREVPQAIINRTYDFDVIRLVSDISAVEAPSEEALAAYLAEHQGRFQRPPTWTIEALVLNDTDVAVGIEVTDDQVRQFYTENIALFQSPESWDYVRISFANQLEANLFQAQINQGSDVDTALASSLAQVSDFGPQTREAFDAETLSALAELTTGDLTGPETAEDGTVTYNYLRAYSPEMTPILEDIFDEVAQALKQQTAEDQLQETATSLLRQVNQENLTLGFVAERAGYSLTTYEDLQTVQSAPEELDSELLFDRLQSLTAPSERPTRLTLIEGKREILFQVTQYEESRDLTLDEGRDRITDDWQRDEATKAVQEQANSLVAQLSAGTDVASLIAGLEASNLTQESFTDLSRLTLSLDETTDGNLISQLDQAARGRLGAVPIDPTSGQILLLNPNLQSPFSLADGEVQQIDQGPDGQVLLVANLKSTEIDPDARPALVNVLADVGIDQTLPNSLQRTYLDNVAATRPATVDNDIIDERRLAERREAERRFQIEVQPQLGDQGG